MADRKLFKGNVHGFHTEGIEDQLKKLGVEFLFTDTVKLPDGWYTQSYRHFGSPRIIYNEQKEDVARWTGSCQHDACMIKDRPYDGDNKFVVLMPTPPNVVVKNKRKRTETSSSSNSKRQKVEEVDGTEMMEKSALMGMSEDEKKEWSYTKHKIIREALEKIIIQQEDSKNDNGDETMKQEACQRAHVKINKCEQLTPEESEALIWEMRQNRPLTDAERVARMGSVRRQQWFALRSKLEHEALMYFLDEKDNLHVSIVESSVSSYSDFDR